MQFGFPEGAEQLNFRAAVHWAAAHHGVDIDRVLLVLTTHGMFWYTSEDAHVMNTGGKKIVLVKDSSNGTYTLLMISRTRELA